MSAGGPEIDGGSNGLPAVNPDPYVNAGNIKIAKLVSTLLGAVWLTAVAGWMIMVQAIVRLHLGLVDAVATLAVRVIRAVGVGGAETLRASWRAAFLSAIQTSKLFAPLMFTLEVILVTAILLWARRRWV